MMPNILDESMELELKSIFIYISICASTKVEEYTEQCKLYSDFDSCHVIYLNTKELKNGFWDNKQENWQPIDAETGSTDINA